jgi:hypothetical protein
VGGGGESMKGRDGSARRSALESTRVGWQGGALRSSSCLSWDVVGGSLIVSTMGIAE